MLEIGSVIDDKYKILSVIGHGGMSTVYLAINEKANKPWAIKEVRKTDEEKFKVMKQSLLVEINLLKKLKHKSLPSIVDVIEQGNNFLIVMDYIEGNTLEDICNQKKRISQEEVISWAIQICEVLEYLHSRTPPIIYRDIKPSNVMLRSDGSIVLIDFGIAREFKQRQISDTTCLGTQGYAAPEQFGGMGQTDERTDLYSLGATMYHLVTGHNPTYPPYEMYPIRKWDPLLSSGLEHIILRCIKKDPRERFQNAKELKYALEHFHHFEAASIKRYQRKFILSCFLIGITLFAFLTGFIMRVEAAGKQKEQYDYYLTTAKMTTEKDKQEKYYRKAISIDAGKKEAYQELIESFLQDGKFDFMEEKIILELMMSEHKYLQKLQESDKEAYATLCYNIGILYWFYYEHEENRQANAVSWFQNALQYYEEKQKDSLEMKRAKMYVSIGSFYKNIISAQITGADTGMYQAYWNDLMQLKEINSEQRDRDFITLGLYEEIIYKTMEYVRFLQEEKISEKEIEDTFSSIRTDLEQMEQNGGKIIQEKTKKLKQIINEAEKMVHSSYKGEIE